MKKTMFVVGSCLLVAVLLVPSLLPAPVAAAPAAPLRNYIIKSIYFGFRTLINPSLVWEVYYSPVTKAFHVQRGTFIQYDSYTKWIGFGGNLIFLKIYLG